MSAIDLLGDVIREIEIILTKVLSGTYSPSCSVEQELKTLIDALRSRYDSLAEDVEENPNHDGWQTHCHVLFEHVIKLSDNIATASNKLLGLQRENEELREEMLRVTERHRNLLEECNGCTSAEERRLEALHLKVGQVAYMLENAIVSKVLAGRTTGNPHINSIAQMEKAIRDESKYSDVFTTDGDRTSAASKWRTLQSTLDWKPIHYRYIKKIKKGRISIAHPTIDQESIRQQLDAGTLTLVVKADDVRHFRELLDMIKKIEDMDR